MTSTQQTSIPPSDRLSLKEIRETLYHCRDFELNLLWQRSLFLFGFLSLYFTGYGVLAVQATSAKNVCYIYQYMCGIALVGIVLSSIWIYMVKGSKAWYEVYEGVICDIEKETNPYPKYRMGVYAENKRGVYNLNFWGNEGGAFSPTKVNIIIGRSLFFIWSVCGYASICNLTNCILRNYNKLIVICISVAIVLFFAITIPNLIKKVIKSRPLLPSVQQKDREWKTFCKFVKHEIDNIDSLKTLFNALKVSIKFVLIFLFPLIAVIYLILSCICEHIKDKYNDYKSNVIKEIETREHINKSIYRYVNNYTHERLEDKVQEISKEQISQNERVNNEDFSNKIDKSISEIINHKSKEKIGIVINRFLEKEIEKRIAIKIDELINDKIKEIQQQLTKK